MTVISSDKDLENKDNITKLITSKEIKAIAKYNKTSVEIILK